VSRDLENIKLTYLSIHDLKAGKDAGWFVLPA
jgi:hypothetical protein